MHDDMQLYDGARIAKLKELRRLMVDLALQDETGAVDTEQLEEALDQAGDTASEVTAEVDAGEMGLSGEAATEEEESPLAIARRNFFKPQKKPTRAPGTAVLFAQSGNKKTPPADAKMKKDRSGKTA